MAQALSRISGKMVYIIKLIPFKNAVDSAKEFKTRVESKVK